jgi:membrane protein YqaA with SNARE-associated domain
MVAITIFVQAFMQFSQALVDTTGFLGLFIINILSAATIIFPIPVVLITFTFATVANPVLVGIVAGVGNTIGELTGYYVGLGGRHVIKKREYAWLKKAEQLAERRGPFFVILIFAATPLPSDVVGLLAGIIHYDMKRFLLATLIGKIFMNLMIAFAGFYGAAAVLTYFGM